jgi:hypothetical protein
MIHIFLVFHFSKYTTGVVKARYVKWNGREARKENRQNVKDFTKKKPHLGKVREEGRKILKEILEK